MKRVPTGLDALDGRLDGGLPVGTITTLVSPPASQYNSLFYAFMEERSWVYVTTYRSAAAVRDELDELLGWGDVQVEHVGIERPIKNAYRVLEALDGDRHVIIDTMNALEATGRDRQYVHFLNGLKEYLLATDRVALLHCTEHDAAPPLRETTLTVADIVWELSVVVDASTVRNRLIVPKYRSTRAVEDVIDLDLDRENIIGVGGHAAD